MENPAEERRDRAVEKRGETAWFVTSKGGRVINDEEQPQVDVTKTHRKGRQGLRGGGGGRTSPTSVKSVKVKGSGLQVDYGSNVEGRDLSLRRVILVHQGKPGAAAHKQFL